MCIELATNKEQIAIIAALADEIWRQHFTSIIGRAQVDYMLETLQSERAISEQIKNGFLYYLIKSNDSDAGYLGVLPTDDSLLLSKFYIREAERGKGLGRKVLMVVESLAADRGASSITLTVNKYNLKTIEIYKKLGFVITESLIQDIGSGFVMDDYRMEKAICESQM